MRLVNILIALAFIAYFGIGLVQLAAIVHGVQIWLGLPWLLAALLSAIVVYIPILGTIAGIKGATTAWGWRLMPTIVFFCAPYVIYMAATAVGGLVDLLQRRRSIVAPGPEVVAVERE